MALAENVLSAEVKFTGGTEKSTPVLSATAEA